MEAIAHSPSFAKKVHIPQSVGKDYAAADKGKTFKRGGDMKGYADGGMPMVNKGGKMVPSFAADGIGKMAKGGMASKMKMFEKSGKDIEKKGMKEGSKADKALDKKQMMKAGGRVRRMAAGGTGDPFELSDEDRANYEKNGAENLKRLKGFFGFGDKEEAAPVDRSRDKPPPVIRPSMGGPSASSETSRVSSQSPRTRRESDDTSYSDSVERDDAAAMDKTAKGPQYTSNVNQGETDFGYESQRGAKTGSGASGFPSGYEDSGFSAVSKKPAKRSNKPVTVSKSRETTSVTSAKVPARIDSEKLLRDAEEEVLRKKPTAMTEQMRKAPTTSDLYKGQKSMGDEIGDVLKSFRETIRGGLQKGKERQESKGSTMYAKGGKVKRMYDGGPPEMGPQPRSARLTLSEPEPQSARLTLSPDGSPQMPMEDIERRKAKMAGMPNAAAAMGAAAVEKMRARTGMGFDEGQGYGNRGPQPTLPPRPIEPPMMEDKVPPMPKMPDEEMVPRSPIEPRPRIPMEPRPVKFAPQPDGPSRGIKAGGQVKKMAQGGYAKADGAASRGKTQPKMVKMAKGGFVKTADGCAQRGKTKAFQVKMKRGGMC